MYLFALIHSHEVTHNLHILFIWVAHSNPFDENLDAVAMAVRTITVIPQCTRYEANAPKKATIVAIVAAIPYTDFRAGLELSLKIVFFYSHSIYAAPE